MRRFLKNRPRLREWLNTIWWWVFVIIPCAVLIACFGYLRFYAGRPHPTPKIVVENGEVYLKYPEKDK